MSPETAAIALDHVFRSPSQNIKIEFQGGEPLLNLDLIEHVVVAAEERNSTVGKNLGFVIATNLALLDDRVIEFCRSHEVFISTSLDGPADLHNRNRPRPGRNSWELATAGIQRVREEPRRRSSLGADDDDSLEPRPRAGRSSIRTSSRA